MIRELSYNLPGYGFATCYLMGQAIDLLDAFENIGVIDKMRNTCQLGTIKYVYPGAHHTRYEYVFTQLMLISNVASTENTRRNIELSLSSNLKEYESLGHLLSGGSLMQCLAILSNAGHMYDTFTADRMLIRALKESRKEKTAFYTIYKRNLPAAVRPEFDKIINEGNYYKLHLYHVIHILQGMCRSENYRPICELCIHLASQLIDPKLIKNEATERIFYLYKKIRKIAYLSIDMVYTPASFGANLSRMIYSIAAYVDDLFDENSAMNSSIQQLEEIIHQQIYDAPMCILNTTRIEQNSYTEYKKTSATLKDVFELRHFLREEGTYSALHSRSQPKSIKEMSSKATLLLSQPWDVDTQEYDLSSEAKSSEKLSLSRIAFGSQLAQNLKRLYTAYGLVKIDSVQKDTQSIIAHAISSHSYDGTNKVEFVKFAIRSIYKYGEYFFNITTPKGFSPSDCVFIGIGSKKVAKDIRKTFSASNVSDADQLHEIMSCASFLENFEYSGTIICFVGGIKASLYNKTAKLDELDGFIYLPNRSATDGFAYIIEAKNYAGGEVDAAKQLSGTTKYLAKSIRTSIVEKEKYAYMEITLPDS